MNNLTDLYAGYFTLAIITEHQEHTPPTTIVVIPTRYAYKLHSLRLNLAKNN